MTEKEMKAQITQAHTDGYNRGYAKAKAELENKIADIKANCDFAIEGRDVKIMELTKQIEKMRKKDELKKVASVWNYLRTVGAETRIAELEKENAELKGLKDVATLIRANNDTVVTLMQLNNKLVSKSQQLTKAKEIIKKFSEFINNEIEYDPEHPQEHTDLWNELCEQAEQFLQEIEK